MPYLNVSIDYFSHPKTKRLARLLGRGSEVLPLKLWAYTARYFAKDGRLTEISAAELEGECGWWGTEGAMVESMLSTKFLDRDGETFVVHDWTDHEGHISAFHDRAKAGAKARWIKARGDPPDASSNASSIASSNAPTNLPTSPTNLPTGEASVVGEVNPVKAQEAGDRADAESQARCWISAEQPAFLKTKNVKAMATAIRVLGREKAISEVQSALANRDVQFPFSYVVGKLEEIERDKAASKPSRNRCVAAREDR